MLGVCLVVVQLSLLSRCSISFFHSPHIAPAVGWFSRLDTYRSHILIGDEQHRRNDHPYKALSATAEVIPTGSLGVESAVEFLNSADGEQLIRKFALANHKLKQDAEKANFWTGGSFIVKSAKCKGISEEGLLLDVECEVKGKPEIREVMVNFPIPVKDEVDLKTALVAMASSMGRLQDTGKIVLLPFGRSVELPLDFRFNAVPHSAWVRAYVYNAATSAVIEAVQSTDGSSSSSSSVESVKSGAYVGKGVPSSLQARMQLRINIPETNPAFDTFRVGTVLELVREIALALVLQEDRKVRICVQQSLGEGIFVGLPLALASMRAILERMDWSQKLTPEEKYQRGDNELDPRSPRPESKIRLGAVGPEYVAPDDEVFIIIAPQNVIGGMLIGYLEEMVKEIASVPDSKGRPRAVILVNPNLEDRPSSNNRMQIRGRQERRDFADSFTDIFSMRLLYPSSGGYMFPIRGMVSKQSYHAPWVVYSKETVPAAAGGGDEELYRPICAFDPYSTPTSTQISDAFTKK